MPEDGGKKNALSNGFNVYNLRVLEYFNTNNYA